MVIQKKNTAQIVDFCFIGHFAIDSIVRFKQKRKPTLGGSVTFGSLSLKKYENSTKIGIISNIGTVNFEMWLLKSITNNSIDVRGVIPLEVANTNFLLDYSNHSRTLTLKSRSPDLKFEDIPDFYFSNPPQIIVLAPLCNEISYEYVSKILEAFPKAYIGIDLQGFLRTVDTNGEVTYVREDSTILNITKIINQIGDRLILKGSEIEMKMLSNEEVPEKIINSCNNFNNNGIYIMTRGEAGSLVMKCGEDLIKIPAYKPKRVIDETGPGDVYLAIFLYELINSDMSWEKVKDIAHIASAAASFLVEEEGPNGFVTKKKVMKRVRGKNYII
ncbi:MAG: PfkB family carbohydrate kinase [Promethearchaeota archaeon]|jgi:sugar/nucleoside kinase (ribokinase family)